MREREREKEIYRGSDGNGVVDANKRGKGMSGVLTKSRNMPVRSCNKSLMRVTSARIFFISTSRLNGICWLPLLPLLLPPYSPSNESGRDRVGVSGLRASRPPPPALCPGVPVQLDSYSSSKDKSSAPMSIGATFSSMLRIADDIAPHTRNTNASSPKTYFQLAVRTVSFSVKTSQLSTMMRKSSISLGEFNTRP